MLLLAGRQVSSRILGGLMAHVNDAPPRQPRMRQRRAADVDHATPVPGDEVQDTRSRIQSVALELFIEQGYEQTSLREIAERLGVTKAALYYHFLTQDRLAAIEELIAWARTQPQTIETKREFIRRYADELHRGRRYDVMRFYERNQASLTGKRSTEQMRERMADLMSVLTAPTDPLPVRIKSSLALISLHATWFIVREPEVTDDQRREAALLVALELLE